MTGELLGVGSLWHQVLHGWNSVLLPGFDGRMTRPPTSEEEAAAIAHGEVKRILNVSCAPVLQRVFHHTRVMPQLVVGHGGLLEKAQKAVEQKPGLFLTGAFVGGVGIPGCIQTARRTAQKAVDMVEHRTLTIKPRS